MRAALLVLALVLAAPPVRAEEAAAPAQRTEEQKAALRRAILDGFADAKPKVRAAAAETLVAAWPDSAPVLDEALASKDAAVRLEAARVLARRELGDVRARIRGAIADASAPVRVQAVRVARRLVWPEIEPALIELVASDPVWIVRQEALRGLEDLGTAKCLPTVLSGWRAERDGERRHRYRRVLVKIVDADHGEDAGAWERAIEDTARRWK